MQPPTRVFVVADNDADARKLVRIFSEAAGFVVAGLVVTSSMGRLDPDTADVAVVQAKDHSQVATLLNAKLPALHLVPQGETPTRELNGVALPLDADPAQIRAAAAAVSAGLRIEQPVRKDPFGNDEADIVFMEPLTDRELHVLDLIAEGFSNPEIARQLSISRNTVKFHVSSIIAKLGAASRTEAVTLGVKRGLIIL